MRQAEVVVKGPGRTKACLGRPGSAALEAMVRRTLGTVAPPVGKRRPTQWTSTMPAHAVQSPDGSTSRDSESGTRWPRRCNRRAVDHPYLRLAFLGYPHYDQVGVAVHSDTPAGSTALVR